MPRRLGQHFLRAASVERLLRAIAPADDDVFLEIGPGAGALTLPLASRTARVVAVEIDVRLAATLAAKAPGNVEIVRADALATELGSLVPPGSRLVGNLPYYVSSPLMRRFLSLRGHVRDLHVMLQEEVARRIASPPGSKQYGILSVLYGLVAHVEIAGRFPAASFAPPPKVSSALLRVRFLEEPLAPVDDLLAFEAFLHKAFARRRRTLENNLEDSYANLKDYLRFLNLQGSRRAEALSVVELARLWAVLSSGGHEERKGGAEPG